MTLSDTFSAEPYEALKEHEENSTSCWYGKGGVVPPWSWEEDEEEEAWCFGLKAAS